MPDPLARLLTVPPDELRARRHRAVTAFLVGRGLEPRWLAEFMAERVGPGQLLLTSSPVHGLANATSDLDFIRIQPEAISGPRISIKIFERGHHLEVVSFSAAELRRNLAELAGLAQRRPAETVAGLRRWDSRFEPRRKQTERIVNGIELDGGTPYLDALPALALVWSRAALQTAIEQTTHLCLAEAAGELRGRVGYAYNILLHLMDAVLSQHGDVYTTRKWYLLRWARFVRADRWHDEAYRSAGLALEGLRSRLAEALTAGARVRLAGDYTDLTARIARVTGAGERVTVRAGLVDGADYHPYLPGAVLLANAASSIVVPGPDSVPTKAYALVDLPGIEATEAAALLRAVRARLARFSVSYHDDGQPEDARGGDSR